MDGRDILLGVYGSEESRIRYGQLVAKLAGRSEPITYWITVGERISITGTEQKLAQLSYSTRGAIPDGMLVRVSSIDAIANTNAAYLLQGQFINQLSLVVPSGVRKQVFGAGSV